MFYTGINTLTGNYIVNASLFMANPDSGFHLALVSGNGPVIHTGVYFYGSSGYVFDKSGLMVGGYKSGRSVELSCNVFNDYYSYYYNGLLCHNNITGSNPINYVEYNKGPQTTLSLSVDYYSGV